MPAMQDLLKAIYDKNVELGRNQSVFQGEVPETILMIDTVNRKPLSPQMKALYRFAIEWNEGFTGLDIVNPNALPDLYDDENIRESIELKAEDYKPVPQSDPSDWKRTALLAIENGGAGLGICLYWWKSDDDIEPCIVFINGGTINIFGDLNEYVEHLAIGTFPKKGDEIYAQLEEERGTLSK